MKRAIHSGIFFLFLLASSLTFQHNAIADCFPPTPEIRQLGVGGLGVSEGSILRLAEGTVNSEIYVSGKFPQPPQNLGCTVLEIRVEFFKVSETGEQIAMTPWMALDHGFQTGMEYWFYTPLGRGVEHRAWPGKWLLRVAAYFDPGTKHVKLKEAFMSIWALRRFK